MSAYRIIGVELRLDVNYGPYRVAEELCLVPANLPLPRGGFRTSFRMPCTVHTTDGDISLMLQNQQQTIYGTGDDRESWSPTPDELRRAWAQGVPRL